MTQVVTAAAMWVLFCTCVMKRRRGHDSSIMLAALCMAVAFTIAADAVYVQVDHFLGGYNLANLAKHTIFLLAVFFLSRGVIRAVGVHNQQRASNTARVFLLSILLVQTGAFFAINATPSTVDFMDTFGERPATLVYSLSHFIYFGVVLGITGWVTLRLAVIPSRGLLRIAMCTLVMGCGLSVGVAAVVIFREIARIVGPEQIVDPLSAIYKILLVVSTWTIAAGLSIAPVATTWRTAWNRRKCRRLIAELEPVLDRIRLNDGRFTLEESPSSSSHFVRLHRIVVEIRDTQLVDPNSVLLEAEDRALAEAETMVSVSEFVASKASLVGSRF